MFKFTLTAEDWFALFTGLGSNDLLVPRRTIPRADFLDAPTEVIGKPVPFPYGKLADTISDTPAPTLTGTPSRGSRVDLDGNRIMGFGNNSSSATPPTSVTAVAQSGGFLSAEVYNSQYGVVITAVDAQGRESDPYPFYTGYNDGGRGSFGNAAANGIPIAYDTVDGTQKLHVTWSGGSGASFYRVYLGIWYYGFRPTQMLEVAGTSCDFTHNPDNNGVSPTPGTPYTPGSEGISFAEFWWYAVSALMPDGETALSEEGFCIERGVRRPYRLEWLPITGALGYRIYKRGAASSYIFRFDVGDVSFFDDDLTNAGATTIDGPPSQTGYMPAIYVGTRLDVSGFSWRAFLVAGCAIKGIRDLFQNGVRVDPGNYGVTFAVPGKTNFSTYFGSTPYVDINGRRYTLFYIRGPQGDAAADGTQPVTVSLDGIENVGNGSGGVLTSIYDQYEHFLRNIVCRDYQTGNWYWSGPTWEDTPNDVDIIDALTFIACKSKSEYRVSGGYTGAFVVGMDVNGALAQDTVRKWIARLNLSGDTYSGFSRKSQFSIFMLDERPSVLVGAPQYTAQLGINKGTFEVEDRVDDIENQINWSCNLNYATGKYVSTGVVQNVDLQTAMNEVRPFSLDMPCQPLVGAAYDIATRRLRRRQYPYRLVKFESDMGALTVDLGSIILVSHPAAPGSSGWVDRPCFVMRHEFDPQAFVIYLVALDIQYLYETAITAGSSSTSGSDLVEAAVQVIDASVPFDDSLYIAPNNPMSF